MAVTLKPRHDHPTEGTAYQLGQEDALKGVQIRRDLFTNKLQQDQYETGYYHECRDTQAIPANDPLNLMGRPL